MIFLRLFSGYLIQVVPFAVLVLYPFADSFRYSKRKTSVMTGALLLGLAVIFAAAGCWLFGVMSHDNTLFDTVNVVFLFTLIPCFLWLIAAVRAERMKKVFVFSFALTCALAMVSVSNVISTFMYLNTSDGLPYQGYSPLVLVAFTAVTFPVLLLLLKRCYFPVADSLDKKSSRYLTFLSVALFLVLMSGLSFIDYENLYNPMSAFLFGALLVTVFVIYAIFFRMLALADESVRARQKSSDLQHQLELRDEQYRRLSEKIESSRRMAHDVRHHLITLQGFLNEGNIEEAKEYLGTNVRELENYEISRICEIPVINWVVSYYQALAKEKEIRFSFRIATPSAADFPVADADLSVVLGNLLENAVTAAAEVGEAGRFIRLNIVCSGKMLAVTVDNSYTGVLTPEGDTYRSTKKGHTGVGLSSVAAVAEKYNGGTEFAHEVGVFHSSVMMNLAEDVYALQ